MAAGHFTVAYGCVLAAALLPMVCAWLAKRGGGSTATGADKAHSGERFDNSNPRAWMARQTDERARANAAQANSFEALPFFIGAVIIAHQLGAAQPLVDGLALAFILLRCLYIWLYVSNQPTARSVVWSLGFMVNVAVLFAACW